MRSISLGGAAGLADESVSLVLISGASDARRLTRDRALQVELSPILKPDGLIYFERHRPAGSAARWCRRAPIGRGIWRFTVVLADSAGRRDAYCCARARSGDDALFFAPRPNQPVA